MSWTANEYREFYLENYGEQVLCPNDGTPMVRAERCLHCGAYLPRGSYTENCTECGELFRFVP